MLSECCQKTGVKNGYLIEKSIVNVLNLIQISIVAQQTIDSLLTAHYAKRS